VSPTRRPGNVLILLALAVVAVGAVLIARSFGSSDSVGDSSSDATESAMASDGADAAAMTSSAPYTIKAEPSSVATDAPVTTGKGVDVVLTYAAFDQASAAVQANGFVAGVIEDGGTCTLTLTKGGTKVTATSTAAADATTTSCGLLQTPDRPAPGKWDAVLTYSSNGVHGKSGVMEVTVP
jgi:hypothetical protein